MRAGHGKLQRDGPACRQRRPVGTSHPFLTANLSERTRRRFSDRRSRFRAWEFVIFSHAAFNGMKSKPDLGRFDCLLGLLDSRCQDSANVHSSTVPSTSQSLSVSACDYISSRSQLSINSSSIWTIVSKALSSGQSSINCQKHAA